MFAKNLAANYLGTVWVTLAQLAILPVYVTYLGVEPYGLIGVHATLTILASLSDLGITPAFSREISRLSGSPDRNSQIRSFVSTLEAVYWAFATVVIVIAVLFLPDFIASWINAKSIAPDELKAAIQLMFVQIGLQLVIGFYTGGMLGMQRHVMLNGINVLAISVRLIGSALVLAFISPTLQALFIWLIIATLLQAISMAVAIRRMLPLGQSRFDIHHVRRIGAYATGVTAVMIMSLLLTQIDKVILSRTLTLADFGLYSLATTIAMSLCKPIGPLARTLLPRMNQLVARQEHEEMARLYHQGSQIASFLVMPVTAVVVMFAPELMAIIFHGSDDAKAAAPLVAILAIGYAGNALMNIPYMLTLSYGWLKFGLYQNIVACIVMVPLTFFLVHHYGAIGGAMAWAILTTSYVFVSMYFLHSNLLKSEYVSWYLTDTLPPAFAAAFVTLAFRLAVPQDAFGPVGNTILLAVVFGAAALASGLSLPDIRKPALQLLRRHSGNQNGA